MGCSKVLQGCSLILSETVEESEENLRPLKNLRAELCNGGGSLQWNNSGSGSLQRKPEACNGTGSQRGISRPVARGLLGDLPSDLRPRRFASFQRQRGPTSWSSRLWVLRRRTPYVPDLVLEAHAHSALKTINIPAATWRIFCLGGPEFQVDR